MPPIRRAALVCLLTIIPLLAKAQLAPGSWTINANVYTGLLIIRSINNGVVAATLYDNEATGAWDPETRKLTLRRLQAGIATQTFTGCLFTHTEIPTAPQAIAGTFQDHTAAGPGGQPVYGWYAQRYDDRPANPLIRSIPRPGQPPEPHRPYPLQVGSRIPFMIVHFINRSAKGDKGCPGVMISNSRARGIVIWTRTVDADALALAKELEESPVDAEKFQGYLVSCDDSLEQLQTRAADLKRIIIGKSPRPADTILDAAAIDKQNAYVISIITGREVTTIWAIKPGNLDADKRREITSAARAIANQAGR